MLLKHGIKISICKSMFILVTYMGFVGDTGSYCWNFSSLIYKLVNYKILSP